MVNFRLKRKYTKLNINKLPYYLTYISKAVQTELNIFKAQITAAVLAMICALASAG